MQSFLFLDSEINHFHIHWIHLFLVSFEWFCFQISSDAKYFCLSGPGHFSRELIVAIVYNFQTWNKKEHNIIIRWVTSNHMDTMYVETPNKKKWGC